MKQLTCEMCGSTDLVKQDGVFVCQSCGCKYSVEEAKKMMVEGTVDVSGSTIFVDNSGLINSYQQMAINASDAGNFSEAEEYANKIIEIDPQFYYAWFIKGKAAGWQTTGVSNRFPESISAWINAYQFAPEESKAEIADEISKEASSISFAIITMKSNSFADFRSEKNALEVLQSESMVKDQLKELKEKTDIEVDTQLFKETIGRIIYTGAINASNNADKEFGPENSNRGKYEWNRFTDSQERCLKLLDRAYNLSFDEELCYSICNNYVLIANSILNSCSYTFEASAGFGRYVRDYCFTEEGKKNLAESMSLDKWQKKQDEHDPEKRKSNLSETQQLIRNARKATEKDLAIAQYWETHSSEKNALESEMIELDKKATQYNSSLDSNPDKLEMSRIRTEIDNLENQRSSLGVFKSKEKKNLTEQIEKLTEEEKVFKEKWNNTYEATEKEINEIEKRKKEIQAEFVKDRGPAKIAPQYYITLFDGENGAVDALDLLNYHKAVLPDKYTVKGEGREAVENHTEELKEAQAMYEKTLAMLANLGAPNTSPDKLYDETDENTIYRLKFLVSGKEKNIVLEFAAKDIDSNISKGITYILEGDRPPSSIADYVLIVAYSLLGICPDIDLDLLEKDITEIAFGFLGSGTTIEVDNLLCTITGGTKRGLKLAITSKPAS